MDNILAAKSVVLSALDERALPIERTLAEAGVVRCEGLQIAPKVSNFRLPSKSQLNDARPSWSENEFS